MTIRWSSVVLLLALVGPHPIPFEENGKWGYRDAQGRMVVQPRFAVAQDFLPSGIAAVVDDTGWAYIDAKGHTLLRPFVFDNGPDDFREGLARFTSGGKIGFFNRSGKIVIKARFAFARPFSEGLAAVCEGCREEVVGEHRQLRGGKWGFIDRKGNIAIPLRFDDAEDFTKGKARAHVDGKWQTIDTKGVIAAGARTSHAKPAASGGAPK